MSLDTLWEGDSVPQAAVTAAAPGSASVPPSTASVSLCPRGRWPGGGGGGWPQCSEQVLTEKKLSQLEAGRATS